MLPRAVPMVEAMVALVLVDALMQHSAQCNLFPADARLSPDKDIDIGKAKLGKKLSGFGVE